MHSALCPTCGTQLTFDFLPVAGLVWCPTCRKTISPPFVPKPVDDEDGQKEEESDVHP